MNNWSSIWGGIILVGIIFDIILLEVRLRWYKTVQDAARVMTSTKTSFAGIAMN